MNAINHDDDLKILGKEIKNQFIELKISREQQFQFTRMILLNKRAQLSLLEKVHDLFMQDGFLISDLASDRALQINRLFETFVNPVGSYINLPFISTDKNLGVKFDRHQAWLINTKVNARLYKQCEDLYSVFRHWCFSNKIQIGKPLDFFTSEPTPPLVPAKITTPPPPAPAKKINPTHSNWKIAGYIVGGLIGLAIVGFIALQYPPAATSVWEIVKGCLYVGLGIGATYGGAKLGGVSLEAIKNSKFFKFPTIASTTSRASRGHSQNRMASLPVRGLPTPTSLAAPLTSAPPAAPLASPSLPPAPPSTSASDDVSPSPRAEGEAKPPGPGR